MAMLVMLSFGFFLGHQTITPTPVLDDQTIALDFNVVVLKNGVEVAKVHNVLMEGDEAVKDQLKEGAAHNWTHIALGNGTAPTTASTDLNVEITTCGLTAAEGTISDNANGNWSVSHTFTVAGCAAGISVNSSALKSTTAGATIDYLSGASFGRVLNLENDDQLTINWTHSVS